MGGGREGGEREDEGRDGKGSEEGSGGRLKSMQDPWPLD